MDIHHTWAGDLASTATGDLATVEGGALGTERVLRRLLTNPGEYLWQPEYGAGLARFVGELTDAAAIAAVIRLQMRREPAVARVPEPVVEVLDGVPGTVSVLVRYADAETSQPRVVRVRLPQ